MSDELNILIGQLTELHGRTAEIAVRVRHDAQLLVDLQRETSHTLGRLWECRWEEAPPPAGSAASGPRILRLVEVRKLVGLAPSTIWAMVKDGRFPAPRRLGGRAVGWLSLEVDRWMNDTPGHDVDRPRGQRASRYPRR